ncbi:MAG: FAD/NAD(P)-binding protein [Pseudomonadota bacterium]
MKTQPVDFMTTTPMPVRRFIRETHDTFSIELVPPGSGFSFKAGQFNMLYMFGTGEVPISISGDPGDEHRIIHTIRAYGSVTSRMMGLRKGDSVGVRGPFGNPWPMESLSGKDVLLIAGGIGIAPLRPVIHHILSTRERYGKVIILYGERTPGDLLYRNQLEHWRGRFDLDIDVTVDSAREGWRGNVGLVTGLISQAAFDAAGTVAMLCGPEIMMVYAIRELEARGVTHDRIYVSTERNMKCGIGLCGHCQLGPVFVCKDGPVFRYDRVRHLFRKREM